MAQIEKSELKRIVSRIKEGNLPKAGPLEPPRRPPANRRAVGKVLEPFFTKAGLNIDKLNKLAAKQQKELRRIFKEDQAAAAKQWSASEDAFRQGIESRRAALEVLSAPFTSTFITLDKPFLIWELPHPELDIFVDSNVESMNNWIKLLVQKNSGGDGTQFTFYFLWSNDSEFAAVMNVGTSLFLNGICEVVADTGIFSGHSNWLSLSTYLTLMRWSGWGTDPITGASNDQTPYPYSQQSQYKGISYLQAQGGGLFGDEGIKEQAFNFMPFNLSYELFPIPAGATALFEVTLLVQYNIEDGDEFDHVIMDFASDKFSRRIICPAVELELLTPVTAAAKSSVTAASRS